jgi:hypothetical protein
MGDHRLKILAEARNILEKEGVSQSEKEWLLKLLDVLTASLEKFSPENNNHIENLVQELINSRALLSMLKQQTDELDALKKLSINLTSSLDLPDVLDAVVSEAMRTRGMSIFSFIRITSFPSALLWMPMGRAIGPGQNQGQMDLPIRWRVKVK